MVALVVGCPVSHSMGDFECLCLVNLTNLRDIALRGVAVSSTTVLGSLGDTEVSKHFGEAVVERGLHLVRNGSGKAAEKGVVDGWSPTGTALGCRHATGSGEWPYTVDEASLARCCIALGHRCMAAKVDG